MDVPALGIELAAALLKLYPKTFEVLKMKTLLANDKELEKLQKGTDPRRIVSGWNSELRAFGKSRHRYLLYQELH